MSAIAELRRSSGAMRCLECGKCSTLCPLSVFGGFSAARMAAIHDTESEARAYVQTIDRCLTCGACEVRCPQGVRFTEFVRGLREALPATMRTPCPHGGALQAAARLMSSSNGKARDLRWLGDGLRIAEKGEVAFFVGCLPLFDAMFEREMGVHPTEIARSAIRLLNAAGIEPVIVAQEKCCGHDLLWNGDRETFVALAKANTENFKKAGVKHIITACAECARTWKLDYAEAVPGYQPKIEHLSEFLARAAESGTLKFNAGTNIRVTFQDPCRLARQLGIVEAPRKVLSAIEGTSFTEMDLHGADARCCGTAGFIHCDSDSRKLQEERLDGAAATGAEVLLTACPKCLIHFSCAQREDRLRGRDRAALGIEDLTVFAARNLARGGTS